MFFCTCSSTFFKFYGKNMSFLLSYFFIFPVLFKNIFYWLCYYSCPNFSPIASLHPVPPFPPASTPLVHVHGSCIQVLWLLHFLYYSYHPPVYFVPTNLCFLFPVPPLFSAFPLPADILMPYWYMDIKYCNYFLPFLSFPFHFVDCFFSCMEAF